MRTSNDVPTGTEGRVIVMSIPEPCAVVPDRASILGIGVSAVTLDHAVSTIEQWIERRTQISLIRRL